MRRRRLHRKKRPDLAEIPVEKELHLEDVEVTAEPESEIPLPDDIHQELIIENQRLEAENERLRRQLTVTDNELESLKKVKAEDQMRAPPPAFSSIAATKIVELTRKLREQTSKLESEKTKVHVLASRLKYLEDIERERKSDGQESGAASSVSDKQFQNELKHVKEKLLQTQLKASEARNENQRLQREIKILQKQLTDEVGDVGSPLCDGWRGRAQQILTLQQKIHELTNQEAATKKLSVSVDHRHLADLKKREEDRRTLRESQDQESEELTCKLEDATRKLNATKARIKVLESDATSLRRKIVTLEETNKVTNDESQALKVEVHRLLKINEQTNQEYLSEKKIMENNVLKLSSESEHAKDLVKLYEKNSKMLRNELRMEKARVSSLIPATPKRSSSSGRWDERRRSLSEGRQPTATSLAELAIAMAAVERSRLLKLTSSLVERLDEARTESLDLRLQLENSSSRKQLGVQTSSSRSIDALKKQDRAFKILLNEMRDEKEKERLTYQNIAAQLTQSLQEFVEKERNNPLYKEYRKERRKRAGQAEEK